MNVRTRLIFLGKLALLVGALGVTYGITAYAGLQLSIKSREVLAPDLRGLTPAAATEALVCLLYTSPSPRDLSTSRMPSSA